MVIRTESRSYPLSLGLAIVGLWLYPAEGAIEMADGWATPKPAGYSQIAFEDEAVEAADAGVRSGPSDTVLFIGLELMKLSFPEGHQRGPILAERDSDFRTWLRGRGDLTVEDYCFQNHRWRRPRRPDREPVGVGVPEASTWFAAGFALLGLALGAVESSGRKARQTSG